MASIQRPEAADIEEDLANDSNDTQQQYSGGCLYNAFSYPLVVDNIQRLTYHTNNVMISVTPKCSNVVASGTKTRCLTQ